jgi:pimeloyl-ACP methyl ester carboxylesterase
VQTLLVIIGGLPSRNIAAKQKLRDWNSLPQPAKEDIIAVSPVAQIVRGIYQTPTFLVHGTSDDLIPWQQSQRTYRALVDNPVDADLVLVEGAPHICDLSSDLESESWKAVLKGYNFITSYVT